MSDKADTDNDDMSLSLLAEVSKEAPDVLRVEGLARAGANINRRDTDGNTALMLAVLWAATEVVTALLDLGADIHVQNNIGDDATTLAILNGYEDIADMIAASEKSRKTNDRKNIKAGLPLSRPVKVVQPIKFK